MPPTRWAAWAATPMRPEKSPNRLWRGRGSKWANLCRRCESSPNRDRRLCEKVVSGAFLRCAMYIEKKCSSVSHPDVKHSLLLFFFLFVWNLTHGDVTQAGLFSCCNCEWILCNIFFFFWFLKSSTVKSQLAVPWWHLSALAVFETTTTDVCLCPSAVPQPQYECIVSKPQKLSKHL